MLPLECLFWIWQCEGRWRVRPAVAPNTPLHSPAPRQVWNAAQVPVGPQSTPTHTEGRTLGGRVLPQVRAVDAVPLDQLIGRGVRPEVICGLHLGVLQGAGPHCGYYGGWESMAPESPPSRLPLDGPPISLPLPSSQ